MPAGSAWSDAIDHVLALDPGGRGIAAFFTPGAAVAAARALRGARRVLITTGFLVQPGVAETDGPPGAAVLGRALRLLGVRVRYVTDAVTAAPLAAALKVLGEPAEILEYDGGDEAAAPLLRSERPTHLIAVERPGRSRSGDYLTARGESVAAWNPPLDALFLERSGAVTVGIGDGGNEIGMGNVRDRLAREGALMARIASTVCVDHLVVAGTSNWGAYGVVAALARLAKRPLVHDPSLERTLIEACVAAGAHDGITRRREPTVDGLPLDIHTAVVRLLGYHWSIPLPARPRRIARGARRPTARRGA